MNNGSIFKTTTHTATLTSFDKKRAQRNDWYPVYAGRLDPLLETKRLALQDFKDSSPTAKLHQTLRTARNELSTRIGKAATSLSRLTKKVWENYHLTNTTKMAVYKACVLSTLLYESEAWTTYSTQENKLQTFHLRCLLRILGISWKDKVTNNEVLSKAGIPSMYTLLRQRRLRWLGHVHRMEE